MKKLAKLLIFSDIMMTSAAGLIAPIFAIFINNNLIGGGELAAGLASMIFLLVSGMGELAFGRIVDNVGHHKLYLFVGTAIIAVTPFLYIFITTAAELYIVEMISAIGVAISYPLWYVYFSHSMEEQKEGYTWSVYGFFTRISAAITALVGGYIAQFFGFDEAFMVVGGLGVIGALLLLVIELPKTKIKPSVHRHRRVKSRRTRHSKI